MTRVKRALPLVKVNFTFTRDLATIKGKLPLYWGNLPHIKGNLLLFGVISQSMGVFSPVKGKFSLTEEKILQYAEKYEKLQVKGLNSFNIP